MDLDQQLDSVSSRQDLAAFIQSLISDFETDSESWENNHLVSYLDALGGWTQDMLWAKKYRISRVGDLSA